LYIIILNNLNLIKLMRTKLASIALISMINFGLFAQNNPFLIDLQETLGTNTEVLKKFSLGKELTKKDGAIFKEQKKWQLDIEVSGAKAVIPYFDVLELPAGSKIRAFSTHGNQTTGYFFENGNQNTKAFALPIIYGEKVSIEVIFPNRKSYYNFHVQISEIGASNTMVGYGETEECFVNVNCPEGQEWQDQKRSVARYITTSGEEIGLCTGTLVNNTAQDCKNYFLSAQHCGIAATEDELGQFIFYFNYESPDCNHPAEATTLSYDAVIGCEKIASSGNSTMMPPDGSDFVLFELNSIPAYFNVYYSGWNRNPLSELSGPGTVIQHPLGDIKKISFWDKLEQSMSLSDLYVYFVESENGSGTIEPRSSGSGIFDVNKQLIGTISYGNSGCMDNEGYDFGGGGKLYYHWDKNGSTSEYQLKPWLDPVDSGTVMLTGRGQCLSLKSFAGIEHQLKEDPNVTIMPLPSQKIVQIRSTGLDLGHTSYRIINMSGRVLMEDQLKTESIDISGLKTGVYIIQLVAENKILSKKMILN
jgi:hypothetical protein